ncbi:ATP-binding protein [Mucilaginibacter terrae]|uniref:histidine kinase n=1 Tax=Mucilaginibacter terrae TaxID=1955052 RepID=A0ABU3GV14_9SPHI|nr:ATP-binding protein [Mucilaginibacter terrae]MDT3403613.1 two-component system sensor histidine kinase VicK [Mucilaginibacter terrae]
MPKAPLPQNEQERLAALRSYHILDTATEKDFDDLTQLASAICGTPISLISLVDKDRQWFKSRYGLKASETDRAWSFCAHAINRPDELLEVEDASADARFKDNALVTGDPHIVFYAGVPLVDEDGFALGSLCVIDRERRKLSNEQQSALKILGAQVISKLKLRKKLVELEAAGTRIQKLNTLLTAKEREAMQIIEHAPIAMALHTGEEMNIRFANKMMLAAWGKDELVFGMPFNKALPELAALDFPRTMRQVYRKGIAYEQTEEHMSYVHNGVLKDFYYNYGFTPLKLADGTVWAILNTAVDVTNIVRSRETVKLAEERMRLAVQSAELGTWYIDANTREFTSSARLKEMFGFYADEDMSYEASINQIPDEHRYTVIQAVEAAITKGEAFDIEYPIVGYRDNILRWVRATGKVYPASENGQAPFFSGTMLDITERKQDDQRKNDFIGMVSHELKSPLTSLSGFLQILQLKAGKASDSFTHSMATKSLNQVKKMTALINGFLNTSRLGTGKIQLNKQSFAIDELIAETLNDTSLIQDTHSLIYEPGGHVLIEADRDKVGNVITNLLSNAIKYSPKGGEVKISCSAQKGMATVKIKDSGLGISQADQDKLFDRFYRVQSLETNHIAGHGIGLYLCAEIIQAHGGKIGVESELGKGSAFWFELPIV